MIQLSADSNEGDYDKERDDDDWRCGGGWNFLALRFGC